MLTNVSLADPSFAFFGIFPLFGCENAPLSEQVGAEIRGRDSDLLPDQRVYHNPPQWHTGRCFRFHEALRVAWFSLSMTTLNGDFEPRHGYP